MTIPDAYIALLGALAEAFADYEHTTGHSPVLVGGGAVVLQTLGAFMSGDLDLVAANGLALEASLLRAGFVHEHRRGRLGGGFYHPSFPEYGVEAVSGALFDGRADPQRLVRVLFHPDRGIVIPAIEDMIADRLGQFASSNNRDQDRLAQARLMFKLADDLDLAYLERRISEETGDFSLLNGRDTQP